MVNNFEITVAFILLLSSLLLFLVSTFPFTINAAVTYYLLRKRGAREKIVLDHNCN